VVTNGRGTRRMPPKRSRDAAGTGGTQRTLVSVAGQMGVQRAGPGVGFAPPEPGVALPAPVVAPAKRLMTLPAWVTKYVPQYGAWLQYLPMGTPACPGARASCIKCEDLKAENAWTGLGGISPYTDSPTLGSRLTSETLKKHAAMHTKVDAATASQGPRCGLFALQQLKRAAFGGMWNVMLTMYMGMKAGLSFRSMEKVCRELLPNLKASVDLSKVSVAEQTAYR
jgi:hypothetical protein